MSSIFLFLRIEWNVNDNDAAIGLHRANVLEAIDRFGSLSAAAPAVDVTFRQLWRTVQVLNQLFDEPLVGIRRSGRSSGAFLTLLGKEVLTHFREMQRAANETLEPHFRAFEKLVGLDPNTPSPAPRYAMIDPATIPVAKKQKRSPQTKTKRRRTAVKNKPAKKKATKLSRPAPRR